MAIVLICGSCGKKMNVPDEYAGRKGQCSACGTKLMVPVPKGMAPPPPSAPPAARPQPVAAATKSTPPPPPKPKRPIDPDDDGVSYGLADDELFGDSAPKKKPASDDEDIFDDGDALPRSGRPLDRSEGRGPARKKKKKSSGNGASTAVKALIAVAVIIVGVIGVGFGIYSVAKGVLNPTPSSWSSYSSPDGAFSIAMPGKPKSETQTSPFGGGPGVKMQSVRAQFGIMAESLPLGPLSPNDPIQSAGLLKLFGPALVTGLNGRELGRQENLWVYGMPAVQLKLETSSLMQNASGQMSMAEADVLMFTDGGTLYALWVIHLGKSGSTRFAKQIYDKPSLVFETFKLRGKPEKVKVEVGQNHSLNADVGWAQARGFMAAGAPNIPQMPNIPQPPSFPTSPPRPNLPRNRGGMPNAPNGPQDARPGDPTVLPGPGGGLVLPM